MKRIYIAGPISSGRTGKADILEALENIRSGIDTARQLILRGYVVFCPHLDFLLAFMSPFNRMTKEHYQANSLAWVDVSDAVFVLPGWETSGGTKREIERAQELGIPVFYTLAELTGWR